MAYLGIKKRTPDRGEFPAILPNEDTFPIILKAAQLSLTYKKAERCPECDSGRLVERDGKFGKFMGCSHYPRCKFTKTC